MIEGVNSVTANNAVLRTIADRTDAAVVVNVEPPPTTVGEAPRAPQAPFVSPYIAIDFDYNRAVLQIRDSDTGDVQQQFPTESRLAQISQAQTRQELEQQRTRSVNPETTNTTAQSSSPRSIDADVITVEQVVAAPVSNTSLPNSQTSNTATISAGQATTTAGINVIV